MDEKKIDDLQSITAPRILVGTLLKKSAVLNNIIISLPNGADFTLTPLSKEIHSTAYISKCALIDRSLCKLLSSDGLSIQNNKILYHTLSPILTDELSADKTMIVSLNPLKIVRIIQPF